MLDYLGNRIVSGDTIVYPVRRGSQMWLTDALVKDVKKGHLVISKRLENGKTRTCKLTLTERVVVV